MAPLFQKLDQGADTLLGPSSFDVKQKAAFDQAILERAGRQADNAGPDVLADWDASLNQRYGEIHSIPTDYDGALHAGIGNFVQEIRRLPASERAQFGAQLDYIFEQAQLGGGQIPGQVAQKIRTELGAMRGPMKDATVKRAAFELQKLMDEAYDRSAAAAGRPELAQLRRDTSTNYQQRLIVGKSVDPWGNVSPRRFYTQATKPHNKGAGFADLAREARQVLPDHVGNSGTAPRAASLGAMVGIVTNPKSLVKTLGGSLGGRFINEAQWFGDVGAAATNPGVVAGAMQADEFFRMLEEQRLERERQMRGY